MSDSMAEKFVDALHLLEEQRDGEPLARLHAPEAVIGNVIHPDKFQGPDGARQFWTEYRGTFGEVRSTFRNVIVSEDRAALEWTTEGTNFTGQPLRYAGVSILEIAGNQITRFCAYFDPSALGTQVI